MPKPPNNGCPQEPLFFLLGTAPKDHEPPIASHCSMRFLFVSGVLCFAHVVTMKHRASPGTFVSVSVANPFSPPFKDSPAPNSVLDPLPQSLFPLWDLRSRRGRSGPSTETTLVMQPPPYGLLGSVGFLRGPPVSQAGELPVLAQCAVAYPTSDPTAMARSLAECLPEPSAVVTRLRLCARFQEYNFAHFWALLPFVFCWVPLLALGLLVVRHDMRLLQSRRAFVPQYWIALLLPWLLTATLYYIAQPLSNLVLMFRAYGAGMPATEVPCPCPCPLVLTCPTKLHA